MRGTSSPDTDHDCRSPGLVQQYHHHAMINHAQPGSPPPPMLVSASYLNSQNQSLMSGSTTHLVSSGMVLGQPMYLTNDQHLCRSDHGSVVEDLSAQHRIPSDLAHHGGNIQELTAAQLSVFDQQLAQQLVEMSSHSTLTMLTNVGSGSGSGKTGKEKDNGAMIYSSHQDIIHQYQQARRQNLENHNNNNNNSSSNNNNIQHHHDNGHVRKRE
ncbi:unnamed protein product, partial [Lymnaea stagnalis]